MYQLITILLHKGEENTSIQKLEEQLTCTICLDIYTDPKLLQCFHVYCEKCLVKLVVRDQQGQLSLPCPICRQHTPISHNGVADLQSAFQTNELLEFYNDMKSNLKSDETLLTPSKKVSYCSEHDGKELEFYCQTCEQLICVQCAYEGGKHHGHDNDALEVLFEKYKEEVTSSLEPIEEHLKTVDKALAQLDTQYMEISDQKASIEASIHHSIQQFHECMNVQRNKLINQLNLITQTKLKDLVVQRDQIEATQAQLSRRLHFVRECLNTENQGEVLKMKTNIVNQVKELDTSFQPDILKPNAEADLNFFIPPVKEVCQNYGVVYSPTMLDPSKCYAEGKGLAVAAVGEESCTLLHAINFNAEYCEKPIESLQCELASEVTGAIVRGHVERRGQSQYEISYQPTVKGRHQLHIKVEGQHIRGSPFAVAVTSSVEKLSTPILTIGRVKCPWDVAINQRGEVVVTEFSSDNVSVFSLSGEKLRSFGTRGSGQGQFDGPRGVAVDGEGNIFVADSGNHRIQKFTSGGQFLTAVGSRAHKGNGPLQFDRPLSIALW